MVYGSDLDKMKKVLLQAAMDHEPRLYVRELRDRNYTMDELNRTIDQMCRENDIKIVFNQIEVHLRNEKGDDSTPEVRS